MGFKVGVRVQDLGYKKIVNNFKANGPRTVMVGILGSKASAPKKTSGPKKPGGKSRIPTLVQVATWQEFGTDNIPSRSFLFAWQAASLEQIRATKLALGKQMAAAKLDRTTALNRLGAWAVGQIQKRIRAGLTPELAESTKRAKTVRGKTGNTPLIDTGQLVSSITWDTKD